MIATVTHIVPTFAPVIDGVGDYALNLARHLRAKHAINSRIVVCDRRWRGPSEIEGFEITGPTDFNSSALQNALRGAASVLLHYVGYGFHARGIPVWLVRALESWSKAPSRLITVFHEIWSAGPPWRTVFYLAPLQKKLCAQILALSAHSFISAPWAARLLDAMRPGTVAQMPVSTNIDALPNIAPRSRQAPPWRPIFFGQTWTRTPAIKRHWRLLLGLRDRNELDRVLILGKESSVDSEDVILLRQVIPDAQIEILGERQGTDAANALAAADFMLSVHRGRDLCKSSAAMSAIACGCPVVASDALDPAPLVEGVHFLGCDGSSGAVERMIARMRAGALGSVSANAQEWFLQNADWPILAAKIAAEFQPRTSASAAPALPS